MWCCQLLLKLAATGMTTRTLGVSATCRPLSTHTPFAATQNGTRSIRIRNKYWSASHIYPLIILFIIFACRYIKSVAEKFKLKDIIKLNSHVKCCVWEPSDRVWLLSVADKLGKVTIVRATFVVTATGPLHVPAFPTNIGVSNIGASKFCGASFHTSQWDHSVDLTNKRVAIIGTGASAVQIIPAIADKVKELHVLQRTPAWVIYKPDFPIPQIVKYFLRIFPVLMWSLRAIVYFVTESRFPTLITGSFFNRWLKRDLMAYLKSKIKDDTLREKLTPNFDPGCKRLLFHNQYYNTFLKNNVYLHTDAISAVTNKVKC